ncbi:MAG TPA: nuclear transport factor 2 family protein [Pseudorhodoplanes sp.]|jgi:ketosteroid isomerase-like protein|nr:nuclear transport factor 2 family protein [Pseudorhodoplanes sp.]
MAPVSPSIVQGFYLAYVARDPERMAAFIDDDVEWWVTGPVDLLEYCGYRRGKAAVVDLYARIVPSMFEFKGFDPRDFLIDGDRAAVFGRISAIQRSSGRLISYMCAHFVRFRNDKVVSFSSLTDSFDAAEQVLGHPIAQNARGRNAFSNFGFISI